MKTKMVKKLTGLFAAVLLVGVSVTSVLAASGMVHEGAMHDTHVMAQMGITPDQMAKIDADCNQWMQNAVKSQDVQKEKSKSNLRYDAEDGWVAE